MKIRRQFFPVVPVCVLVLTLAGTGASAQTLVVPSTLKSVEGNENNVFPFDIGAYRLLSMRFQQVYAASEFAALGGPVLIERIGFRPDGPWGWSFDTVLPNVQINLSTTKGGPDSLETEFSANVGADETVVYSGPLHISSHFNTSAGGTKDFDIQIQLTNPFRYDPKAGNLLLDVRNWGGGTLYVPFDSHKEYGDSISCVYSYGEDSVLDAAGFYSEDFSFGLVTQFTLGTNLRAKPKLVAVDIKPQTCPNGWNIKSEGVLPAAVLGLKDFDVATIDPASIRLAGVAPRRSAIEDVAAPYSPLTEKTKASDCTARGPDGNGDLTLKFDSTELFKAIQALLGREPCDGEALTLVLNGSLKEAAGGSEFQGEDVLVILRKGKK